MSCSKARMHGDLRLRHRFNRSSNKEIPPKLDLKKLGCQLFVVASTYDIGQRQRCHSTFIDKNRTVNAFRTLPRNLLQPTIDNPKHWIFRPKMLSSASDQCLAHAPRIAASHTPRLKHCVRGHVGCTNILVQIITKSIHTKVTKVYVSCWTVHLQYCKF